MGWWTVPFLASLIGLMVGIMYLIPPYCMVCLKRSTRHVKHGPLELRYCRAHVPDA